MKFFAYTRGFKNDYKWSSPPEFPFNEYLKENGVVIYRNANGRFSVYFCSEATDKTDYQQRKISVALLISGSNESKAKGLACWALEHFGSYASDLEQCIKYAGTDHWELDEKTARQFADSITEIDTTDKPLIDRTENTNMEENRQALRRELQDYDFSPKSGLKLCVDGGVKTSEKLDEIRSQVQRYLTGNASFKCLEKSKKYSLIFNYINRLSEHALPFILILFGFVVGLLFANIDYGRNTVDIVPLQKQVKELDVKIDTAVQNINTLMINLQDKIEKLNKNSTKQENKQPQTNPPPMKHKPLNS